MIKKIFLNYISRPSSSSKEHCTYQEAKKIGILYNADEYDEVIISTLKQSIERDSKLVTRLGYIEEPSESSFIFSKEDISVIGTIKKENVDVFTKQTFDFLISFDTSEDIHYKYVLARSKAVCKVGLETHAYRNLLQMSLKPEKQKTESVRYVMQYLKMI